MIRSFVFAGALALVTVSANAATTWTVDPAKSSLGFRATQAGASFEGSFKKFTSEIAFDPADLATSKITTTVDIASVTTASAQRDGELPKPDWFDTSKFPKAVFTTTKIESRGTDKYLATGTLQIRDQTLPIALPFTLTVTGNTAKAVGSVEVDRTNFGVGQGSWATTDMVGRKVMITIDLAATRAP
jgi:polyisoprenoid-binding protein YceI